MNNLFQQRRQKHFLMLLKYWRLVFNDHFVIALFFLFGALAYGYAQLLPNIPSHNVLVELVLTVFMTIIIQLGRLATLVKKADPVFLLPQTAQMNRYYKQAYLYSWGLGIVISLAGMLVALPLVFVTMRASHWLVIAITLIAVLSKTSWLNVEFLNITMHLGNRKTWAWARWLMPLATWLLTWIINPTVGLILAVLFWGATAWLVRANQEINWRQAVYVETSRMASVYRFFNLFTDVPNMQGRVRRRRLLQPVMQWLQRPTTWGYLYSRGFIRNTEISDLVTRLTLVMALILMFVPVMWLNSVIMVLALYLIAAQLIPLYDQYVDNAFTYVYPVDQREQLQDFISVIRKIMLTVGTVLVICSFGVHASWQQVGINLVIAVIEIPLLTTHYLKNRLQH